MGGGWIIAAIIIGLIAAAFWAITKGTDAGRTVGAVLGGRTAQGGSDEIAALRQNLRAKALGNEALIDRLVQAERNRLPGASEAACYKAAIERWERDNR